MKAKLTPTHFIVIALVCSVVGIRPLDSATAVPVAKNTNIQTLERHVHINPPGDNDSRYAYVPFDVPTKVVRISINYQYDRANDANAIDIGLFDSRATGSDADPRGFRGWSGGKRSEFFVSRNDATPGYLKGDMPAGTWRIILGLYKVAPSGVDIALKIVITTEESSSFSLSPRTGSPAIAKAPNGRETSSFPLVSGKPNLRWWSGDLHMHTVHSDGDWTISDLVSTARRLGLDFICVTDHNTSSHHAEIDQLNQSLRQPLLLRGEEITTYGGHTNAWGLPSGAWIDFRVRPGDNYQISRIAGQVHRTGALISINHPFALCGGCAWSYDSAARDFDAIEVWNGSWDSTDDLALAMWDKILQSGRHITAIGSSDSHRAANPIGRPTTHVAAKVPTQRALLDAILKGRVYLSTEVAQPALGFEAETMGRKTRWMVGDEIHLTTPTTIRFLVRATSIPGATISLVSNGQVLRSLSTTSDGQPQVIEIECRSDSYYRLEVRDAKKAMLALTNPIYLKVSRR
jgi:PHP domain/PHP-associated